MLFLALIFIVVPLIEIYVLLQVGQAIGPWWTILLLVVDSLIGVRMLRWQGGLAWRNFQQAVTAGKVPHREVLDGVLIVTGGALLLTPGFVTDIFGLVLLIPPTRAAVRRLAVRLLTRRRAMRWTRVVVRSRPAGTGGSPEASAPIDPGHRLPPG